MATFVLPADGTLPNHSFRVSLDGTTYEVQLRWNQRSGTWQLSLFDADGNSLLGSRRLLPGWPLLGRLRARHGLPRGELYALDTTGADKAPGQDDLGTRVLLCYVEEADLT